MYNQGAFTLYNRLASVLEPRMAGYKAPPAQTISKNYLTAPKQTANPLRMARVSSGYNQRMLMGMNMAKERRMNNMVKSAIYKGAIKGPSSRPATNAISKLASRGMGRVGSFMERALVNKKVGFGLAGAAGVGALALGVSYGIASMARASKRPPVVHTAAIRSTGQTNQYYNMGADPFGGVRFAAKNRNL